ncbi:hypothetical protein LCGC14_0217470 [marine sediment metagenome]|uniref:Uncharacterized protein n=2 Tax=root TaxID=1 RepID=A0A0F9UID7_9ZZZZ
MVFFGAKWLLRSKAIVKLPIAEKIKNFTINRSGLYSVCILGGGYLKTSVGFKILISKSNSQEKIRLKENFLKWRFRKNREIGVEYLHFEIENIGEYHIEIQNPENLTVKKSRSILQSDKPIQSVEILIKESVSVAKKLFGVIFLVLGVNISFWGIMLAINPNPFG